MADNTSTSLSEELLEQAGYYLMILEERPLTEQEGAAFRAWLLRSDAHKQAFEQVALVWCKMDILQGLADIFPVAPLPSRTEFAAPQPRATSLYWKSAVAASLLLTVCLTVIYYSGNWSLPANQPNTITQNVTTEVHTDVGQIETISMEDGSRVIANTNSRLSVSVTKTQRQVVLDQGEAFFEVEHDPTRTFDVVVDNMIVRAVGTAFSVYRDDGEVKIVVTQGIVEVIRPVAQQSGDTPTEERSRLHPGQVARYGNSVKEVVTVGKEELARKLSWRQGMLAFEGEPLQQVIEQFSRYNDIQLEVSEDIRDVRVGGYFNSNDVAGMLNALQGNFGVKVTYLDADHVLLSTAQ